VTGPRVVDLDGDWLEIDGQWSLRELVVHLGLPSLDVAMCDAEDCTCPTVDGAELTWTRDQVVQLRDQLDEWLQRGQP
jgi:hypothetical protein